jgi:hypothetical protein
MMDSRWANQVGVRAERLRDRIKNLNWEAEPFKSERDKMNDLYTLNRVI